MSESNKPTPLEQRTCRSFLAAEIAALANLKVILALGRIGHDAVLSTLGVRKVSAPFSHGALHEVQEGVLLADSYHCSRYNVNTGVLTESMFHEVVAKVAKAVG